MEERVVRSVELEDRLKVSGEVLMTCNAESQVLLRVTGPDRQQSCFDHCSASLAEGRNKDRYKEL